MTAYYNEIATHEAPHSQSKDLTGSVIGSLRVVGFDGYRGTPTRHAYWFCICECGESRIVRGTNLARGVTKSCSTCSRRAGAIKAGLGKARRDDMAAYLTVIDNYKRNARKRGIDYALKNDAAIRIMSGDCFYCGVEPSAEKRTKSGHAIAVCNGIDRVDNTLGYTENNSVSCCHVCNFAKRDMGMGEFLSWVKRIHEHQTKKGSYHDCVL